MAPTTRSQNREAVDKAWNELTEALYQRRHERARLSSIDVLREINESVNRALLQLYHTPHAFDRGCLPYTRYWGYAKTYQWAHEFVDKASQESDHRRSFRYCIGFDNATQEVELMRRMWGLQPDQPTKAGIKRCNAMSREEIRKLLEDVDDSMEVVTDEDVNLDSDQDSEPRGPGMHINGEWWAASLL